MHFKRLEIFGFKSFANRTVLNFEPGVTAIVGPNGCGKSNIADAIKWVLGEQRPRELRGLEMQDIIFNGTDSRSSVGLAEVSLTLSNSPKLLPVNYEEVTVSRRVFRSGESIYLLNKIPCRLKDIVELFMGTGIGTTAYSMMAQGKIDLIISSKPEERRYIFDEAAGITKYKSRKKEALRKLEQTESNLLRVSDIITEVKRQIGSIERQAKKAQRYQGLFENLKELELKLAVYEYSRIKNQKAVSEKEISLQSGQKDLVIKEIDLMRTELAELERQLGNTEADLLRVRQKSMLIDSSIDKNQHQIALDRERSVEIDSQEGLLTQEIETIIEKIDQLNTQISRQDREIKAFSGRRSGRQELLSKKENGLAEIDKQIKANREKVTSSRNQLMDVAACLTRSRNELAKITVNLQNAGARQRRLKLEQNNVQKEKAGLEGQVLILSADEQNYQVKTAGLHRELEINTGRLQLLEGQIAQIADELNNEKSRLALKSSKKEFLEELKTSQSKDLSGLSGMIGVVSDLITVEKGYHAAIETALKDYLSAIIIDSLSDIESAVSHLSKKRNGRVTFLIKDILISEPANSLKETGDIEGVLGRAVDFVKTDSSLKGIISYLLKDVLIVGTFRQALSLGKNPVLKGCNLITLNGETVVEDKLMTVGFPDEEKGILSRQLQYDELGEEIKSLAGVIADNSEKLRQKHIQQEELQKIGAAVRKSLHNEELAQTNVNSNKANLLSAEKKFAGELSLLGLEIEEITFEIEGLKQKEQTLKNSEDKIKEKDSHTHNVVFSSQEAITFREKEREKAIIEIAELRAEVSVFVEREKDFLNTLQMLKTSFGDQNQALELKRNQIETGKCRKDELEAEMKKLKNSIRELSVEKVKAEETTADLKLRSQDLKNKTSAKKELFEEKESIAEEIKNKIHNFNLSMAEISYKGDTITDRISRDYKVKLEEYKADISGVTDWDRLKNEVLELKAKVEAVGPVNLVAIEEHEELKDRFSFLTSQRQDLENAKDSLHSAIGKINRTTRKLFMESFEKIQDAFKDFFKLLFEGGNAQLVLLDQNNTLESGIEIIARPPGKKLQNISLLSGGEKALTAVALLFAIFKVKPSPFCVLDEIDGPLDESNITRFTRVLNDFVKTSQFIIITHNKKTISMADVMYGVTMEESGVSKLVSVKLTEKKPAVNTAS
ncbi:MAG: chromosome segregation protein SMC [Candidatus Omnitrophota bacterium]|nr:chromosome segregation protein SMC [Candidatus Omnitrophota bacterium]